MGLRLDSGPPEAWVASQPDAPAHRVLVVEDDPAVMRMIVRVLTPEWDIVSVADGQAALEAFQAQDFSVLVTDLSMPTMGGLALLEEVRRVSEDIPVILITGNPSVESAVEAVALRAFKYLPKPFGAETLRNTVREATRHTRMARMRRRAFEVANNSHTRSAQELQVELDKALRTVWLAYQPIVNRGSKVIGYEALLRWTEGKFKDPIELLSVADRLGAAEELGRRIRILAPKPLISRPHSLLFMNLDPNQVGQPYTIAQDDPLALMADRVVVELTEHMSLKAIEGVEAAVPELKAIGYRIAVDDLGAGYSGLSSFAQIGPDFVKLDRKLVTRVGHEGERQRVIAGIIQLCHDLDMEVIAEGIEMREDLDKLVDLGCDFFQGYLIGRPAPLE
jgi:EAL domain-containing protein (putative c-di-GMP-specific phosphodiesterase class I)